jgi:hypothetical protein
MKVFPEAVVVQTHRDPRKTLPSFCSMVAHSRGIFSDAVDTREIARHWCRKTRRMVELTMRTRDGMNPDQCIDISYYDLLENPVAELRRILQRAGIGFGDEAVRRAERYLEAHPQNRYGKHTYHLADFGLSEAQVEEYFSLYRERHGIPIE